jgi:hypothetical protein
VHDEVVVDPPTLGSVIAIGLNACEASVIPQSLSLFRTRLPAMTMCEVGPASSVSRMPPTSSATRFPVSFECVTLSRCSASPQSSLDWQGSGMLFGSQSWSLWTIVLSLIFRCEVWTARTPSRSAFSTVKPLSLVPAAPSPEITTPLSCPVASIVA